MRHAITHAKAKKELETIRIHIDYAVATCNYAKYRLYVIEHRANDYHHLHMIVANNEINVNY